MKKRATLNDFFLFRQIAFFYLSTFVFTIRNVFLVGLDYVKKRMEMSSQSLKSNK